MVEGSMMKIKDVPGVVKESLGWEPTVGTVRQWIKNGHIKARKVGGRIWVDTASVNNHLNGKDEEAQ
jgi:hypothetical protein